MNQQWFQRGSYNYCLKCERVFHVNDIQGSSRHFSSCFDSDYESNEQFMQFTADRVRCTLCDKEMHVRCWQSHFLSSRHEQEVQSFKVGKERLERIKDFNSIRSLVERLSYSPWRQEMKERMYNYLFLVEEGEKKTHLAESKRRLCQINAMEVSSNLELAIWKTSILGSYFDDMQDIYDYSSLDVNFDRKRYTKDVLVSCGSSVIIPLVLQFLFDETQNGTWERYDNFLTVVNSELVDDYYR